MRADGDHTTEGHQRLALYLLGALRDTERESFEAHLAECWFCLKEAATTGLSAAGLAWLDEADWTPGPDAGTATGRGVPTHRPGHAPAGPAGTRPGTRRRRLAARLGTAVAAAVFALAGATIVIDQWSARDDLTLTATGEAPAYGTSLSVTITTNNSGHCTIRITVTGLRAGLRHRLYAVTRDGTTHVIRDWTASAGPQQVTGETSLRAGDLSFVTVGPPDGPAIVTAPLSR
ncbi:zf-HC2 domain-containing protein [Micromonospora sp. NPDC050795]|uniref:zf-HC2 domain-containing protein n=1 Tax=Micromonospora sp. NPDC050795 TaxID=3364282 RepID=UPI003798E2B0